MLQKNSPYGINFDYKIIPTSRDIPQGKKYSGFSFIEAILSVFLVSIGMIAVLSLMSKSLRETMDSRDQIIAVLLSQEGTELVRNLRDNNWAKGRDTFSTLFGFPANSSAWLRIDTDSSLEPITQRLLKLYNDVYNHDTGTGTKFRRFMKIRYDNNTTKNTATVISIVTWTGAPPASNFLDNYSTFCNTAKQCAYTETVLSRWGGM